METHLFVLSCSYFMRCRLDDVELIQTFTSIPISVPGHTEDSTQPGLRLTHH